MSERPSTYKLWTDEKLRKAYEEVNGGHLSVRRAAELYGVPKSTLTDRVTVRVDFGSHSGPARYLSDAEEEELVSFLCGAARLGYARTKRDVLAVVEDVVAIKKKRAGKFHSPMDGGKLSGKGILVSLSELQRNCPMPALLQVM